MGRTIPSFGIASEMEIWKCDRSSIQRGEEIRKFYKQIIKDYVYIVRSIIPEQIIEDHIKLFYDRFNE